MFNKVAIHLKSVCFSYSQTESIPTLNNLTINIPQGKYTTILGHNGSGKSTLCKVLLGSLIPQKGEIFINGIDLIKDTKLAKQQIGVVFQNPENQFIGNSVRDDIAFGLENKCIPSEKMDAIINKNIKIVEMEQYLDYQPHHLSGGQKQKVAIASVLALDTDIIVFDESTSMLDPRSKTDLRKLMIDICQNQKKTVISITHDMNEANNSDHVIVLKQGKVILEGTPNDVFLQKKEIIDAKLDFPFPLLLSNKLNEIDHNFNKTLSYKALLEQLWQ